MSGQHCAVCGSYSDVGCEWPDDDEFECPFRPRLKPDPDDMRDLQIDMRRVWGDER